MPASRGKFLQAALVLIVAALIFKYGIRPPMPLQRVLALHGRHADGGPGLRLVGLRLVARLRGARSGRRSPSPAAARCACSSGWSSRSWSATTRIPRRRRAPRRRSSSARSTPRRRTRSASAARRSTSSTPTRRSGRTSSRTPPNREKHLAAGAAVYIRNCVYCHGDLLDGQGHFAHGFNPQPADFVGPNTIAQLSEGFVFWRIAKGGPGLPKESTPWNSAMPAWEDRLTEEQIWQVIYYLYETTGHPPRVMESHAARPAAPSPASGLLAEAPPSSARGRRPPSPATSRSASRSTRSAARDVTAPAARVTAPPPSSSSRARGTSPPGSTRSAPWRARSRPTRTSSGS